MAATPPWARDAVLSAAAIGFVGLSASAFAVLYGRRFGDEALGHAGLALAVGTGVPQVACAGLVGGLTRFVAARRGTGDVTGTTRALWGGLVASGGLAVLLAATVALTAPAWAARIGLPHALVAPAAWLVALEGLYFGLKAALYGLGRVTAYAVLEALGGVAFAGLLAAVLLGAPIPAIAPFLGADGVIVGLGLALVAWNRRTERAPGDGLPDRAADAGGSMARWVAVAYLGTAASLARLRLPVVITGAALGAGQVGLLHAAFAAFAPLMLAPRALELALLPSLATAYGRDDRVAIRRRTAAATAVVVAALSAAGGALVLAAEPVLGIAFGPAFVSAAPALAWVVAGAWLVGVASPSVVALSGADGVAVASAAGAAGLGVSLAVWWAAVPALGATGAAAGFAAGSVVAAALPMAAARRRYGVPQGAALRIAAWAAGLLVVAKLALIAVDAVPAAGALAVAAGYVVAVGAAARGPLGAVIPRAGR